MNFFRLILEAIFRRRTVLHFRQVLHLLQLLELFVVADVRIVGGQTHQVVHETENDEETREARQNEHDFCFLDGIFAEGFHFKLFADFHVFFTRFRRKQEV